MLRVAFELSAIFLLELQRVAQESFDCAEELQLGTDEKLVTQSQKITNEMMSNHLHSNGDYSVNWNIHLFPVSVLSSTPVEILNL